jgi:starch phosphorylase
MLREYVTKAYVPSAQTVRVRECDGGRVGRELAGWRQRIQRDWHGIHFGRVDVSEDGGQRMVSVPVYLGTLDASDVAVELFADGANGEPPVRLTMMPAGDLPGAVNAAIFHAAVPGQRPVSDYTPRVIPAHPTVAVPVETWLVAWQR